MISIKDVLQQAEHQEAAFKNKNAEGDFFKNEVARLREELMDSLYTKAKNSQPLTVDLVTNVHVSGAMLPVIERSIVDDLASKLKSLELDGDLKYTYQVRSTKVNTLSGYSIRIDIIRVPRRVEKTGKVSDFTYKNLMSEVTGLLDTLIESNNPGQQPHLTTVVSLQPHNIFAKEDIDVLIERVKEGLHSPDWKKRFDLFFDVRDFAKVEVEAQNINSNLGIRVKPAMIDERYNIDALVNRAYKSIIDSIDSRPDAVGMHTIRVIHPFPITHIFSTMLSTAILDRFTSEETFTTINQHLGEGVEIDKMHTDVDGVEARIELKVKEKVNPIIGKAISSFISTLRIMCGNMAANGDSLNTKDDPIVLSTAWGSEECSKEIADTLSTTLNSDVFKEYIKSVLHNDDYTVEIRVVNGSDIQMKMYWN